MAESPSLNPRYLVDASSAPQTPQPPFSPPQRFSSLALAPISCTGTTNSPSIQKITTDLSPLTKTPQLSQAETDQKRLISSPLVRNSPLQLQRVLQAARGAFHRDMFAASSPASSIESRMNLERTVSWQPDGSVGADTKEWRYSTAPQHLAAASVDVREPLSSPTLPETMLAESDAVDDIVEPVSSGFASPTDEYRDQHLPELVAPESFPTDATALRMSSGNSHTSNKIHTPSPISETQVNQDLQRLQFSSDRLDSHGSEASPAAMRLKNRSSHSPEDRSMQVSPVNSIYLSESAEAAAESAKAKRRWLKGIFPEGKDDDDGDDIVDEADVDMGAQLPNLQMMCPDPMVHEMIRITPCPEPSLHSQSPSLYRRPVEYYDLDVPFVDQTGHPMMPHMPSNGSHRATATGSPMPFPRLRSRPATALSERQSLRSPTPLSGRAQDTALNEHFQPGWYYARDPVRPSAGPSYSFSTAASKAIGSDQAPDSRMRDSYKTDTLTALPVPTTRYRKNGIGAQVMPRGVGRYYERPPSSASSRMRGSRPRPSSRQTYVSSREVRFRSSPPRALAEDRSLPARRKRAMDDSFIIAEDTYLPSSVSPELQLAVSGDEMQSEGHIDMAVRTSVFGNSTPEAFRDARQGIRELSPNVQLFRKGTQENMHLRKKRRPSYWDNDLKEVRESPAGRGGVRSPVSAQESMRAELEEASQRDTEMDYDEDGLIENAASA